VHELSICQSLLAQVTDIAASRGASVVARITVELGPLCGVEPALLASAFEVARAGSCAEGAELHIEIIDVSARCAMCGATTRVQPNRLVCGECGDYRMHLVSGDEMRLRGVELRLPQTPSVLTDQASLPETRLCANPAAVL
jgi:hydrogenase nickel incorporation protein HypA/HybF